METKKVQLSNAIVTVKTSLTWGDSEKIESALMSGAKIDGDAEKASTGKGIKFNFDASVMLEQKYVRLECMVVEIEEDGKKKQFTREWVNNLSKEDGDLLYNELDPEVKKN